MDNQTAVIIPARYGSSRLKGKPLIEVGGKPIIQWVFEKAVQANLADRVIIATDNQKICDTALMFGAEAEMTLETHSSGSDRIAEVALRHPEIAYIVNLQGDEPMIDPENIDRVIQLVKEYDTVDISTLVTEIKNPKDVENPNLVKCVFDNNGYALYFSRSKIPFERNTGHSKFYGHIGIYGYKRKALFKMTQANQTPLELTESLEQLRALQMGMKIKVAPVENKPIGIDTIDDLNNFKSQVLAKI
ncbi:MAG: 3-deoxy-manno-octulosonate cytidylyltransferase [Candidatus Gastranaerophilales bacterium]|nr:3-deoxy-manno-octulosonate cytidylyltransferase [Candidatus Gastranaerophilales bacterium]